MFTSGYVNTETILHFFNVMGSLLDHSFFLASENLLSYKRFFFALNSAESLAITNSKPCLTVLLSDYKC